MKPYGIVFKEDIRLLEESVRVWQKRYGILKAGPVIRVSLFVFAAFTLGGIITNIDSQMTVPIFIFALCFFAIMAFVYSFFVMRKRYVRQITKSNYQSCEKQIVLYGDCLEITTGYGKGRYYYDELAFIHEEKGIITIVIDSGAFPYSVCPHGIIKGDYLKFAELLQQRAGAKYEYKGGRM